jgi:hypothetical protein
MRKTYQWGLDKTLLDRDSVLDFLGDVAGSFLDGL